MDYFFAFRLNLAKTLCLTFSNNCLESTYNYNERIILGFEAMQNIFEPIQQIHFISKVNARFKFSDFPPFS